MVGLSNALLLARTAAGQQGTAGRWPAVGRRIAGIATQSRGGRVESESNSLFSLVNVTFVNYIMNSSSNGTTSQPFYAFEPCGRCQMYQGGTTTPTAGLRFVQQDLPALASWSWAHQVCLSLLVHARLTVNAVNWHHTNTASSQTAARS